MLTGNSEQWSFRQNGKGQPGITPYPMSGTNTYKGPCAFNTFFYLCLFRTLSYDCDFRFFPGGGKVPLLPLCAGAHAEGPFAVGL